jgi:hypothetical protein
MATGLLIDIIQLGSSYAESVISEWNLKCASIELPVEPLKSYDVLIVCRYLCYKKSTLKLNTGIPHLALWIGSTKAEH